MKSRRIVVLTPRIIFGFISTLVLIWWLVQLWHWQLIWKSSTYERSHRTGRRKEVTRTKDILGHSYITLWLHQFHRWFGDESVRIERVKTFVEEAKEAGFGAIMTDLPWEWTEREQQGLVDIHSFQKDWMAVVCQAGLKLHVVLTMREFPPWLVTDKNNDLQEYREATSQNCPNKNALQQPILQPSPAHPVVWQRMQSYVEQATMSLVQTYGQDCLASISPTLNNEFETRYTQTNGLMRDYSIAAVNEFHTWQQTQQQQQQQQRQQQQEQRRGDHVGEQVIIDPPQIECQGHCHAITGKDELAWMAFREEFLAGRYEQLCRISKRAAATSTTVGENKSNNNLHCLLHMGEMLATTDHLNSNLLMRLATSDVVDELVMDSNMMLWGAPTSPSVVGLMVSLARTYPNKIVHYELATERVLPCTDDGELALANKRQRHHLDPHRGANLLIRSGVIHALEAGIHSLGVTNLCKPTRANIILPMQGGKSLPTSDSFQPTAVIFVPHGVFYAYSFAIAGITCDVDPLPCWDRSFATEIPFFGPAGLDRHKNQDRGNCPVDAAQVTVLEVWDELRTRHSHVAVVADVKQLERVARVAEERVLIRFPCVMMKNGDERNQEGVWKIWQGDEIRQTYEDIHRKYPFTERQNRNLC